MPPRQPGPRRNDRDQAALAEELGRMSKERAVRADPFLGLQMFTEVADSAPPTSVDADGRWNPCCLFRGRENWLSRFSRIDDAVEQTQAIRDEVRALVARWLKMQNLSVLMGAGASRYVTGFVGVELFERVKSLLTGRPSAETLRKILERSTAPEKIGSRFEEFLSQLSALSRLGATADWPLDMLPMESLFATPKEQAVSFEDLQGCLLDLERAIAISCNVNLPPSPLIMADGVITPHESFLAKLVARDPQSGRARIFTTNYDTLVEQAVDRTGILCWDGFTGSIGRRFDPATYDLDFHYPGDVTEGRVRRYDKVVHLYKLHGSINWRRSEGNGRGPYGVAFDPRPLPAEAQVLKAIQDNAERANSLIAGTFQSGENLAILPTSAKYAESLAMPFAHLFRLLNHALSQPQTVLMIIGYSGWDRHVNRIIEDALANPGFTCVILNPVVSPWAERLLKADYSGRVYCYAGQWATFESFAENVMPDLEVMRTELAVARTLRELGKPGSGAPAAENTTSPGGADGGASQG